MTTYQDLIRFSVPHGIVLCPFLFSIFTTPVGNFINSFSVTFHHYTDNTQLYTTIKLISSDKLASLSACADAVTSWHLDNDLLLNPNKTEEIITGTRQQIAKFNRWPALQSQAVMYLSWTSSVFLV